MAELPGDAGEKEPPAGTRNGFMWRIYSYCRACPMFIAALSSSREKRVSYQT